MECTEDGELTVLTLGEEKVREGSYNIINDYAHQKSERPGDEGHWAYAHFPDFETFSRVIIGETTENRVPEMNYNLQLGLTTLYLESHDEIKRCLGNMMDTRSVPMEEQKKQDEELIKARESLRNRTAAIHTAWNIQGVLHMWRAHCQSPKYAGRFGRNLYKEILCAWKKTRDFLGDEDTVSIKWLDTWVSKFNDYYQQKEDWVQQTLSWNMIHDAGDAEFGHDSIRHWQVEINKFRYRHRSILDIDTTIAGIKERMSQFRLMIKDPNSYHGWAAGNCYWQIKTEEFRILANQLMDLEFRQRLQDHPSSNTKFLELDRLALIIFKNQTIESFKALGTSAIRADLMIETWFATFGLLLNYDMICTGYAWSVIRSTSLMDTDCFIISYQDLESKKAGWQCPVTMTKITSFLTGLKSFIKRRADSLRKRNRKAAAQLTESRIAHLDSATEGVEPELNRELELTEASSQGEVGQTSPEVSGSKGKSTAPTLSNPELTKDSTNLARTRRQDSHENTPSHPSTKTITTMPGSSRDAAKSKTKPAPNKKQSTTPISTPPTEASNFDWFEEVIEPAVDSCSSIYGGSHPAAEVESIGHQKPATGTPVPNLNNLDRNKGITYASVTKTGAREVSLAKPLVPSSPTPSLPTKEISQSKIPRDTAKEDKFIGYIEPSSGPWIEVTKKKPGETPPETQNIKNPRKKLVFSVRKNKADTPKAAGSLPKNEQAIDTRKIEKSAQISPADRVEQAASRVTAKNTPAPTNRYHTDTNNYPHLPRKSIGPQTPTRTAAVIAIRGSVSSSRQVSGENVKKVESVQPKERAGQPKERNRELHYANLESVVPRANKTVVPPAKQDSIPVRSQRDTLTGRELETTFNPEPRETKLNETDDPTIGSQEPESDHLLEQGSEPTTEEMPGKSEIQGGTIRPFVSSSEGAGQESGKLFNPQQSNAPTEGIASRSSPASDEATSQSQLLSRGSSTQSTERGKTDNESLVDGTISRFNDSSTEDHTEREHNIQSDDGDIGNEVKDENRAGRADRPPSPTPSFIQPKPDEYLQPGHILPCGVRDGQDIVATMDRVTHGNRPAPSLEDLVNMQAATAHSDGTNGAGPAINGDGHHEGGISTGNCDREEYFSYTLLAEGVEGAVCDMLEEWYNPS